MRPRRAEPIVSQRDHDVLHASELALAMKVWAISANSMRVRIFSDYFLILRRRVVSPLLRGKPPRRSFQEFATKHLLRFQIHIVCMSHDIGVDHEGGALRSYSSRTIIQPV